MKAETRTVQEVLRGDRRFVVPVYQRPYVWDQEQQWEPLWPDVEATAVRLSEVRGDAYAKGTEAPVADQAASPHFLGAVVIEDRPVMTGDVDSRLAELDPMLSSGRRREAAELAYAIAVRLQAEGRIREAGKFARKCLALCSDLPTSTIEQCTPTQMEVGGVSMPDLLHDDVVRSRLGHLL